MKIILQIIIIIQISNNSCLGLLMSFAYYILITGGQLTAEKAFVSLTIFNMLRFPLDMIPESFGLTAMVQ